VVRDVDAGYGAVRVLHGVSIEVRDGETVALLGTNGNGKSTLIKCIMGMLTPDAGEIYLERDGTRIDLATISTETCRSASRPFRSCASGAVSSPAA
jgi:branched-chain amino acid transport system ATP-binding protein